MFIAPLRGHLEHPVDTHEVLAAAREARIRVEDVARLVAVEDVVTRKILDTYFSAAGVVSRLAEEREGQLRLLVGET